MNYQWSSLKLDPRITNIINVKFKFSQMTPVQAASIPILMKQKDVTVEAVTGSGKTLAFVLPIIQMVINKRNQMRKSESKAMSPHDVCAVIISPTIELAKQSYSVLSQFVRDDSLKQDVKAVHFVGGSKATRDEEKYVKYGGNVVVSTPGRLAELLDKCVQLRLSVRKNLEVLVLDEADQLLSMGFETTINEILRKIPKQRKTCLFSATQTKQLEQLIRAGLRNPVKVEIKSKNLPSDPNRTSVANSTPDEKQVNSTGLQMSPFLNNFYMELDSYSKKLSWLINFILIHGSCTKTLIFFATCAQVDYFSTVIDHFVQLHSRNENSFSIFKMHRKLRGKRAVMFAQFSESKTGVLLCTDVMARGIDIKNIDWVIHFDLPNTLQHYIHRSGRSGHQVGQSGHSLLLTLPHEKPFVELCSSKNIELKLYHGHLFDSRNICHGSPQKTNDEEVNEPNNGEMIVIEESDVTEYMKDEAREKCSFYELAMTAFVSFIRTYSTKNVLSQTLFHQLDVISLVNCFGLLKIPIMPELRGKLKSCPSAFVRKSGDREIVKTHISNLREMKGGAEEKGEEEGEAKNKNHPRPDGRRKMRQKIRETKLKGKRKKELIDQLEFNELADDMRMIKKLKRGKISQQQFDEHFSF